MLRLAAAGNVLTVSPDKPHIFLHSIVEQCSAAHSSSSSHLKIAGRLSEPVSFSISFPTRIG